MPNDTEMAAANDMCGAPFSAPANTTPTAMPSGRLCMVTARASIAVFDRCERMPSGLSVPICRCGVSSSISSRQPMPNRKPTAAGITDHAPLSASVAIAGMSNDHTFFIASCILPNYLLDLMLMYILPSTTFSTA